MSKDQAVAVLVDAYVEKFRMQPDFSTMLIIKLSAPRVINGEEFEWRERDPAWRELHFLK